MVVRILLLFLCFAPSADGLLAQRDVRLSIPARLETGVNFAETVRTGTTWLQRPGPVVTFGSGLAFRFKERLALSFEGGVLFDTYGFFNQTTDYSITNFLFETRAHIGYLFPFKKDPTYAFGVGFDYGETRYVPDFSIHNEPGFTVTSRAFGGFTRLYSPEIGLYRRTKNFQMSWMFTYVYHDRAAPTFQLEIREANGSTLLATAKGDYIGFRFRAMFDVWGHKTPIQNYEPDLPVEVVSLFNERPVRVRETITSKRQRMVLRFWDNADVDGDSISVSVNGRFVLSNHALDKAKKRVVVILEPGENVITVFAHNEGRVPPNTSACSIRTGFFRKSLVFSTGMNRNEALIVNY
jgi:hypothetical protein